MQKTGVPALIMISTFDDTEKDGGCPLNHNALPP